jgi:hypothetical protein
MANTQQQFGELILTFTSTFTPIWNDKDSGGKYDGAFWQPVAPQGFAVLGSVGVKGYGDINGQTAALCVKAANPGGPNPPLVQPSTFTRIWKDAGSGALKDGACWRPVAPNGYVAMGDVFATGYDTPPPLSAAVCVRSDLTHAAVSGPMIWDDEKTGAAQDFSAWEVLAPAGFVDPALGLIAGNTFVGVTAYTAPAVNPVLNVLMLPLPVVVGQDPPEPVLTSYSAPPASTAWVVDRTVTVPFTAVTDASQSVAWKVANSPFYRVLRSTCYELVIFEHNNTSVQQSKSLSVTVGVSTTQSSTFSASTGISVTAAQGIDFVVTGEVSATVSMELGFQTSTGITQLQDTTVTRTLIIPAQTATALWATSYALQAVRADGALIAQPLSFQVESFVSNQYPPVTSGQEQDRVQVLNFDPNKIGAPVPS